jgi:hypothetical protein
MNPYDWMKLRQLDACVFYCEVPFDCDLDLIARLLPGRCLLLNRLDRGQPALQALPLEYGQLTLSYVMPTTVFRCVAPLNLACEATGLGRRRAFMQDG